MTGRNDTERTIRFLLILIEYPMHYKIILINLKDKIKDNVESIKQNNVEL